LLIHINLIVLPCVRCACSIFVGSVVYTCVFRMQMVARRRLTLTLKLTLTWQLRRRGRRRRESTQVRQGKDTSFRDEEEEEPLGATPCDKRCRIFCHLPATDDAESPARLKFGTPSKAARERQCGACSFVPLPSKKYSACNLPSSFLRIHLNTKKIIFDFWISI